MALRQSFPAARSCRKMWWSPTLTLPRLLVLLALLAVGARGAGAGGAGARACATQCAASDCGGAGIRWGRYCGVVHTGCPGTAPCDAYDACCQAHDACVRGGGLSAADVACHSTFTACRAAAEAARLPPWSDLSASGCSVRQVVSTMTEGIRRASAFAGLLGGGGGGGGGGRGRERVRRQEEL